MMMVDVDGNGEDDDGVGIDSGDCDGNSEGGGSFGSKLVWW